MSETITKAMKRPGAVPAALTALGVLVALLAIGFAQGVFSTLSVVAQASIAQDYLGAVWFGQLVNALHRPAAVRGRRVPLPVAGGTDRALPAPGPRRDPLDPGRALLGGARDLDRAVGDAAHRRHHAFATRVPGIDRLGKLGPDAVQACSARSAYRGRTCRSPFWRDSALGMAAAASTRQAGARHARRGLTLPRFSGYC